MSSTHSEVTYGRPRGFQRIVNLRTSIFLLLCFVFGGTSQAVVQPKIGLYCGATLIIAWVLWRVPLGEIFFRSKILMFIFGGVFLYSIIQIIPLPPSIWTKLPGHGVVVDGFKLMELPLPWLPISLAPERTLSSLFDFLPPIAAFLLVVHLADYREKRIAVWTVVIFAMLTVGLGLLQVNMEGGAFYFYAVTNPDLPVGFFSNGNHQATMLLMALALSFALLSDLFSKGRSKSGASFGPRLLLIISLILGLIIGLALNTSVAGYLLMPVVVSLSIAVVVFTKRVKITKMHVLGLLIALPFIGFVFWDLVFLSPTMQGLVNNLSTEGDMTRVQVFAKTIEIIPKFFPFGSGLGSYQEIFRLYEDKNIITNVFSPHTHNDYLEFILEFGLVGIIAILSFVGYWGYKVMTLIGSRRRVGVIGVAASIAILAVLLHSIVDYPLRTIAISTLFSFCLALQNTSLKRKMSKTR